VYQVAHSADRLEDQKERCRQVEESWRVKSEREQRAVKYGHEQEVEEWRGKCDEATSTLQTKLKTQVRRAQWCELWCEL
jgi:hypothetical protein